MSGGDRRKFDLFRDVYKEEVQKKAVFNLDIRETNTKGEVIEQQELSAEQHAEMEFKNQAYERAFKELEGFIPQKPEVATTHLKHYPSISSGTSLSASLSEEEDKEDWKSEKTEKSDETVEIEED